MSANFFSLPSFSRPLSLFPGSRAHFKIFFVVYDGFARQHQQQYSTVRVLKWKSNKESYHLRCISTVKQEWLITAACTLWVTYPSLPSDSIASTITRSYVISVMPSMLQYMKLEQPRKMPYFLTTNNATKLCSCSRRPRDQCRRGRRINYGPYSRINRGWMCLNCWTTTLFLLLATGPWNSSLSYIENHSKTGSAREGFHGTSLLYSDGWMAPKSRHRRLFMLCSLVVRTVLLWCWWCSTY